MEFLALGIMGAAFLAVIAFQSWMHKQDILAQATIFAGIIQKVTDGKWGIAEMPPAPAPRETPTEPPSDFSFADDLSSLERFNIDEEPVGQIYPPGNEEMT